MTRQWSARRWAAGLFDRSITRNTGHGEVPIPMVLHCPKCGTQHIDQATPEWPNPPHRSHACQKPGCGAIWRPADVATAGVDAIPTRGKSDNWAPGDPTLRNVADAAAQCLETAVTDCITVRLHDRGDFLAGRAAAVAGMLQDRPPVSVRDLCERVDWGGANPIMLTEGPDNG